MVVGLVLEKKEKNEEGSSIINSSYSNKKEPQKILLTQLMI